jgi:hypothetical protein
MTTFQRRIVLTYVVVAVAISSALVFLIPSLCCDETQKIFNGWSNVAGAPAAFDHAPMVFRDLRLLRASGFLAVHYHHNNLHLLFDVVVRDLPRENLKQRYTSVSSYAKNCSHL